MPDSSRVWLNSGSTQTNPGKPFMVKAGGLNIKATGTTFNVKAYPEENQVTTTLVEGIVIVEGKYPDRKDFKLKLNPSQSVCYYKQPEENEIMPEKNAPATGNELLEMSLKKQSLNAC